MVPAVLNLLFAITILVIPFFVARKARNLPTVALIAMYSPGTVFLLISLGMFLFCVYLFCGGSPSFQ